MLHATCCATRTPSLPRAPRPPLHLCPQSLHYMRKLCSHPAFVLDVGIEEHRSAATEVLGRAAVASQQVGVRAGMGWCGRAWGDGAGGVWRTR